MKRIHWLHLSMLLCLLTGIAFSSCTVNDDNPAPEQLAEATILWFGTGGGNADASVLNDLRWFYKSDSKNYEHVNIVIQYKNSLNPEDYGGYSDEEIAEWAEQYSEGKTDEELEKNYNAYYLWLCHPKRGATYRFAIDCKKTLRQQFIETEPYGEPNCDITCPDSLTNFINWAAANYPAKKYILITDDHGTGYFPDHDIADAALTRGQLYDDGQNDKCFSAKSFARGVRNANVRPEGIVLYECDMNNMETLYDMKDITDYIVASTYTLYGSVDVFDNMVDNLAAGNDTKTTLENFVDANMDLWDRNFSNPVKLYGNVYYYDLTMTKTSNLNDLAPVLKEFTDRLVDTYQNGTQQQRELIDQCTANAVKVDGGYPFYDFAKYMVSLFDALPEVFDDDLFSRLSDAFNACIVKQRFSKYLTDHNYSVDYSVILAAKGNYVYYVDNGSKFDWARIYYTDGRTETYWYKGDGYDNIGHLDKYEIISSGTWSSTFANTYQQTTFDRLVGWSRFLLINQAEPQAWSAETFNTELP